MNRILKLVGLFASGLAILDVYVSFISGVGILLGLASISLSGLSAISGDLKYAIFSLVVVTFNLFFVSVVTEIQDISKHVLALIVSVPYSITLVFIILGYRNRQARHK